MILVFWNTRSKRRDGKLLKTLPDYGLKRISDNMAAGKMTATEVKEFRTRIPSVLSVKNDIFLIIRLCDRCERSFLQAHPKIKDLDIDEFENEFHIY